MEGNLRFKSIGLALQLEVNLPFLFCFTLYLRAIFQVQAPRDGLGGLYLERLIHGGACFQNLTACYRMISLYRQC